MSGSRPVIRAIVKRDLKRWFGNPTGYVFITLFVLMAAAALYWPSEFFRDNLANLDSLNTWFPWLLLFFAPAITMNVWAGERGQGTDELLLTLPATDLQIVLGKYLAAAGTYTFALLFCFPIGIFLAYLGDPDWGLMAGNVLGYWLLGLTLIAAGMIGSQLSENLTIAFIFGAVVCAMILLAEWLVGALAPSALRAFADYGPVSLFNEMGRGMVALSSVFLFVGMIAAFVYLNLVLLSRRHWHAGSRKTIHFGARFACLVVATVSVTVIGANRAPSVDTTVERIHSLSEQTHDLITALPDDNPVFVQAYVSPKVPREYVQTRRTLLDLLRRYESMADGRVRVRVIETERFSDEAREAETNFSIQPQTLMVEEGNRSEMSEVYLGVAFTCGLQEVVIPFLDKGLPIEYELTRSIRTVANLSRLQVGVLDNDVKAFGGMDFETLASDPQWEIVRELRLQYDVKRVDPASDYPEDVDVLVALMPSTLLQEELDRLAQYIRKGKPTLLVDDPFPAANPGLGPSEQKGGPRSPFAQNQPPPPPKGNIEQFFLNLGMKWPKAEIVWDSYNPHPQFSFEPEIVFVGESSGSSQPFSSTERISSGLQELVAIFPGYVEDAQRSGLTFASLVQTTPRSGALHIDKAFNSNPLFGRQLNRNRRHVIDSKERTLACRVHGRPMGADADQHVIFVADLDMVSSQFFEIRRRGLTDFSLDNVTFILNCVDELAGTESFIELRKRRPRHRTLTRIEEQERQFTRKWLDAKEKAEEDAQTGIENAQARLDEAVDRIRNASELDTQSKRIQIESVREVEKRRLESKKAEIEDRKNQVIELALADKKQAEDRLRGFFRIWALALTPIPGVAVGVTTLLRRRRRERETSVGSRQLGGQ